MALRHLLLLATPTQGIELSSLGAPLPRGFACVTMDASSHRGSFAFFLDVVAAISDEGPSMAIGHHVGAQVAAIGAAKCEDAAVAIEGPGFAGNVAVTDEGAQMCGGGPSCWPVVLASRRHKIGATRARRFPIVDRSRHRP